MGKGALLNKSCKCGSGKKYKKCCYMKTENRKCPVCEKANDIPVEAENFTCKHCSTNLIKTNKPSLTKVFETKDEIDQEIYQKIMINFVSQLSSDGIIFAGDKKKQEEFTGCIFAILQSLSKANSHRRKYVEMEKDEMEKLYTLNAEDSGSYVGAFVPVELNTQFDGVLVHVKAALDSLAKATKPLFGFNLPTWKKVRDADGKEKSGLAIVKSLKNITRTPDEKLKQLIEFMEKNIDWITYIVTLRDNPVHKGGTLTSNLIFSEHTKKVTPQLVIHPDGQKEQASAFMERNMKEIVEFMHIFLMLSFNFKALHNMTVAFDEKGDAFWHMPELAKFTRNQGNSNEL